MGWEILIAPNANWAYVEARLDIGDGSRRYSGRVGYDLANLRLYYVDSVGARQTIASGLVPSFGQRAFQQIKLIVDATKKQYVRAIFNGVDYPLVSIPLYDVTATVFRFTSLEAVVISGAAANGTARVGQAIYTYNEP